MDDDTVAGTEADHSAEQARERAAEDRVAHLVAVWRLGHARELDRRIAERRVRREEDAPAPSFGIGGCERRRPLDVDAVGVDVRSRRERGRAVVGEVGRAGLAEQEAALGKACRQPGHLQRQRVRRRARADVDRPAGLDRERDERLGLAVEQVEPLQRGVELERDARRRHARGAAPRAPRRRATASRPRRRAGGRPTPPRQPPRARSPRGCAPGGSPRPARRARGRSRAGPSSRAAARPRATRRARGRA